MTDTPIDVDLVEDVTEEEDPRISLLDSIAESMANLSEASDTPAGINATSATLSSGDVDFQSDTWTAQLADLQGWLSFGDDLPLTSIDDFLRALVRELGLTPADALDPTFRSGLTARALERLNERLDTAVRLQVEFLQELESKGASRSAATQAWADSWGEFADNDEPMSPEPVTAKAAVWPIFQLTKKPPNLTPSYQRGDVWKNSDRQALIESILRGVPLPSIILLRTGPSSPHEVVDGKQRLTAILRFVGKHPVAIRKIKDVSADLGNPSVDVMEVVNGRRIKVPKTLEQLFNDDYPAFRKAWKSMTGEALNTKLEDAYYFPFKLRTTGEGGLVGTYLEPLRGKYYTQIKRNEIRVASQELTVEALFEDVVEYTIPVIEYTQATQRQIHEVFRLYNKQGVHLNAEEIRNAVYHEVELTRATLVAAGDADATADASRIAPASAGVPDLERLGQTLTSYGFGASRYKKTKVLSWIISVLLHDTCDKDLASTSRNIDQYLDVLRTSPSHPLNQQATLTRLLTVLNEAVEIHDAHDELWSEKFKHGDKGAKWQELQLVGSLVGITMAQIASPDDLEDRIDAKAEDIRAASEARWVRPSKTQTRTQWEYIAKIVKELLHLLDLDPEQAATAVEDAFGSSGYASLQRTAQRS